MIFALSVVSLALSVFPSVVSAYYNCTGTTGNNARYVCGDSRLGPIHLPETIPIANMLYGYDRFGGLQPGEFLRKWTFENGSYHYPDVKGFQNSTTGVQIEGEERLVAGMLLDRFGSTHGMYLAPAYTPFAQRALPPSALNDSAANYHVYRLERNFTFLAGTTASWFGQPGQGTQYWFNGAVADLLANKTLSEVKIPARG
ncbi:hypothetical protein B0H11DRAFT_1870904 [Mycena galericulata]|nr:hypothetical protein B0H11DRAFT_1870904 [Mycena galericulata]